MRAVLSSLERGREGRGPAAGGEVSAAAVVEGEGFQGVPREPGEVERGGEGQRGSGVGGLNKYFCFFLEKTIYKLKLDL